MVKVSKSWGKVVKVVNAFSARYYDKKIQATGLFGLKKLHRKNHEICWGLHYFLTFNKK